jgi:hypothetical protein
MNRSRLKRLTEEDKFSRRFACWANNHHGWRKAKKQNRRIAKRRLKREGDFEEREVKE